MQGEAVEHLSLKDQFKQTLEETRIVLPGIQTLFGFQFIAIFNSSFEHLPANDQRLHLGALFLTATATAAAMAPVAIDRQIHSHIITDRLVHIATRLVAFCMIPLAAAIVIDFYIVTKSVLHDQSSAQIFAGLLALVLFGAWLVLPQIYRAREADPG